MDIFVKLIEILRYIFSTLGVFFTVAICIGLGLLISLLTPVYSQVILHILNQISLPANATLHNTPTAIVVLGGGLTNNLRDEIVINKYTRSRLQKAQALYQQSNLPIIASGKESPWMMRWLQQQGIWWVVPEKNSFNTCENAKFTAKLISVNDVILVTDAYHMNRARRQFALNGISTSPMIADLPQQRSWSKPLDNLQHSRRASYELLAFGRDILKPQNDCKSEKQK